MVCPTENSSSSSDMLQPHGRRHWTGIDSLRRVTSVDKNFEDLTSNPQILARNVLSSSSQYKVCIKG